MQATPIGWSFYELGASVWRATRHFPSFNVNADTAHHCLSSLLLDDGAVAGREIFQSHFKSALALSIQPWPGIASSNRLGGDTAMPAFRNPGATVSESKVLGVARIPGQSLP